MGDANVRRPVATRFEHGVDFGLLVHKSPFMADDKDPLVLSNYIFELLEVNPGVAGFLIQLHPDDVDAVVESVTAHAEKGAGTKTTLYVGMGRGCKQWGGLGLSVGCAKTPMGLLSKGGWSPPQDGGHS